MKRLILLAIISGTILLDTPSSEARKSHLIDDHWKFSLNADSTAIGSDTPVNDWTPVTLPHDWSINRPFDREATPGNDGGYLPGGTGWYIRELNLNPGSPDTNYQLYVEGAYMDSEVYVNGKKAGGHPYGYSSYFVDITPYVKSGNNRIAIKVDNSMQKNCRWYSGSGLYRNVRLIENGPVRISNHGIGIITPTLERAEISVALDNETDSDKPLIVRTRIGSYEVSTPVVVPAKSSGFEIRQTLDAPGVKPWSPDSPNLYTACIEVIDKENVLDSQDLSIGFRTIGWDAANGLMLNGKHTVLNGGCVHHDNGILGAAAYPDAERRRVRLLKDAGFNAVRTSHNIPSEEFLNACDEIGLLVIDEAFDGWRDAKNDHDYHKLIDKYWEKDLDAMLLRDRNHPSVFCWSIGNEVIERKKLEVVTTARKLASRCHATDPSRPVTSALASWDSDWEIYDPLAAEHDITGYNYMIHKSESDHRRVPERVMMQTESYPADAWKNYRKVADNTYIIGDFVWTAIDYIGESGIGRWYYEGDVPGEHFERPLFPWHAAYCGDIDLTGYRKPISHYRSMLWNEDGEKLFIAVREPDGYNGKIKTTMWGTWPTFESWNWPGHEGKPIEVEVYSRYPEVRLTLDGEEIGRTETSEMKAVFTLPYRPGTLMAEGIGSTGKTEETRTLATAGAPAAIRITPESKTLASDGTSLAFIGIEIVDKDGNVVPVADNGITAEVTGGGTLLALGNADIKDTDPYFDAAHHVWKGRALLVVRSNGKKGNTNIKVSSPGLKTQSMKLLSRK